MVRVYVDLAWEHRAWLELAMQERSRDAEVREALQAQFAAVREQLRRLLQAPADRSEARVEMVGPATHIIMVSLRGFLVWARRQTPAR